MILEEIKKRIRTTDRPCFSERLDAFLMRYLAYFNYLSYAGQMRLRGNERILEIGCGGGNLSRIIARRLPRGHLVSFDILEYWIALARKRNRFSNVDFLVGGLGDLDLDDSSFDYAIFYYVLHDISGDKRSGTIKLVRDKLKKGGRIYIREPMRKSHGMDASEIENLMGVAGLKRIYSKNLYSILMRSQYEGSFEKG